MPNPDSKANSEETILPGDLIYRGELIVHKHYGDPGADLNHNANIHTLQDSE